MGVKEYLEQVRVMKERLDKSNDRLEGLRELARSPRSVDLSRERVSNSKTDFIGDMVARVVDLEEQVALETAEYLKQYVQARKLIMTTFQDNKMRCIYIRRHLLFETWKQITDSLGYVDVRRVQSLHKQGLSEVMNNVRVDPETD